MDTVENTTETPAEFASIIIDFGTHKRKHVKRLRKGKAGKLLGGECGDPEA
ncbi:MAG: hypothetical protein GY801_00745 [bacterium]|nr:hypothetical protein [bacterium]